MNKDKLLGLGIMAAGLMASYVGIRGGWLVILPGIFLIVYTTVMENIK